jgi:hypothetical protein
MEYGRRALDIIGTIGKVLVNQPSHNVTEHVLNGERDGPSIVQGKPNRGAA